MSRSRAATVVIPFDHAPRHYAAAGRRGQRRCRPQPTARRNRRAGAFHASGQRQASPRIESHDQDQRHRSGAAALAGAAGAGRRRAAHDGPMAGPMCARARLRRRSTPTATARSAAPSFRPAPSPGCRAPTPTATARSTATSSSSIMPGRRRRLFAHLLRRPGRGDGRPAARADGRAPRPAASR